VAGGVLFMSAGSSPSNNEGGSVNIYAGASASGRGGIAYISGGMSTSGSGGSLNLSMEIPLFLVLM